MRLPVARAARILVARAARILVARAARILVARAARILVACVAACGVACGNGETRRFELARVAPPVEGGCALPVADELFVRALGDFSTTESTGRSGPIDEALELDTFPDATEELVVELRAGNAALAIGRTGRFELSTLDDGAVLSVFVAPPRSFCRVAPPARARANPIAVRAGRDVLVLGGSTPDGGGGETYAQVAELYDPTRGAFETLASTPFYDLRGGRAAATDGSVLVVWSDGFQIYDVASRSFGVPTIPSDPGVELRANAQLARLRDGSILVAGGCDDLAACAGTTDAQIFDPDARTFAPAPPLSLPRACGHAFVREDGAVWIVGGVDETGAPAATAEIWEPASGSIRSLAAPPGAAAPLAAGGVLGGFAPAGAAPDDAAAVLADGADDPVARTSLVARAGATLTSLEDGAILALGGVDPAATGDVPEAELYRPHLGRFEALFSAPDVRRREHAAVVLDDGSVLVLGGRDATGAPLADAWIYRHDLVGPRDDVRAQVFNAPELASLIVPGDPERVDVRIAEGRLRLVAAPAASLPSRAALAGPRYVDVAAVASATASPGVGIGLLVGIDADETLVARVVPGEAPRVARLQDGALVCAAPTVLAADALLPGAVIAHQVGVAVRDGRLSVTLDGVELVACDVAAQRGLVGVAAIGDPPGELSVVVWNVQR